MADYNIPIAGGAGVASDGPQPSADPSLDAQGEQFADVGRLRRNITTTSA